MVLIGWVVVVARAGWKQGHCIVVWKLGGVRRREQRDRLVVCGREQRGWLIVCRREQGDWPVVCGWE